MEEADSRVQGQRRQSSSFDHSGPCSRDKEIDHASQVSVTGGEQWLRKRHAHAQWRNEGGQRGNRPRAQHQRGAKLAFSGTQYYDKND